MRPNVSICPAPWTGRRLHGRPASPMPGRMPSTAIETFGCMALTLNDFASPRRAANARTGRVGHITCHFQVVLYIFVLWEITEKRLEWVRCVHLRPRRLPLMPAPRLGPLTSRTKV